MPTLILRALFVAVVLLPVRVAFAQICPAGVNPCVISADTNVPGGTVIDIGARDFVVAAGKTLNVQSAGRCSSSATTSCQQHTDCPQTPVAQFCRPTSFFIIANNVTLQDGAKILSGALLGNAQSVIVQAAGAVVMGPNSRIESVAGSAGSIDITAGSVAMNGFLRAQAGDRDGDGGDVSVVADGHVAIGGLGIEASAGDRFGCPLGVQLVAGGDVTVAAPVVARGGDCDGGDIDLSAVGDVVVQSTGRLDVNATYESGSGGSVFIDAGDLVDLSGPYDSRGQGTLIEGGGDGGDLDVLSRSFILGAQVALTGAGPDGSGGFIDVSTIDGAAINAPIVVTGAAEGTGGDVYVDAGGAIGIGAALDLRGGIVGGSFDALAIGDVSFTAAARIDASAIGGAFGSFGGTADIRGCSVTIPSGAVVTTTGGGTFPNGLLRVFSSNLMTIGGTLTGVSEIALRYRTTPPSIQGSAVIVPAPTVAQDATLPCCVGCPTTTTTTSSSSTTSSSTSTSTTSSSSTSTSLATTTSSSTTTSTSSSVTSTSSSTTTVITVTTSTTLPPTCLEEPLDGLDAVDCALGFLQEMVVAEPDEALGGKKSARRLRGKLGKADVLVEKARVSGKPEKILGKARRKVVSFDTQIGKLIEGGKLDPTLGGELLDLSTELTVRIDGALVALATN